MPACCCTEHHRQCSLQPKTRDVKRTDSAQAERQPQHVDLEQIRPVIDGQEDSKAAPRGDEQEDSSSAPCGPVQFAAAGPEEQSPLSSGLRLSGDAMLGRLCGPKPAVSGLTCGQSSEARLELEVLTSSAEVQRLAAVAETYEGCCSRAGTVISFWPCPSAGGISSAW